MNATEMPTSLKPNGKICKIREQTIVDLPTGITLKFEVNPNGETRLHMTGDTLPHKNRTLTFGKDGENDGGGTRIACRAH